MMANQIYLQIAKEIETGQVDVAAWTQAFAECDGDKEKTKALYIRRRHAELAGDEVQSSPQNDVILPEAIKSASQTSSELDRIRGALDRHLTSTGRSSLYANLQLSPQTSDEEIRQVIAAARLEESKGTLLSSETEYAISELGQALSREAYDRRLFRALSEAQKVASEAMIGAAAGDDIKHGWGPRKVSIVIGIAAVLLFGYLSLGIFQTKVNKDIATEVISNQRQAIQTTKENETYRASTERSVGTGIVDNQARAIEHSAQIENRRVDAVEKQIENQANYGTAQIELERERLAEQKKHAAWMREQQEQARIQRTLNNLLTR